MGLAGLYLLHDTAKEASKLGAPGAAGDSSVGLLEVIVEGVVGFLLVVLVVGVVLLEGLLLDVVVCEVHGWGGWCSEERGGRR